MDQDQWTIIENTHEPIIDQETYDNVQRLRKNIRRYPDGWGEAHPLGGLLYCADCGGKMYVHRTNNGKRIPQFTCAEYGKIPVGSRCKTQHRVNADVVMTLIKETLREIIRFSKEDEDEFVRIVRKAVASQQTTEVSDQKTRLEQCRKRSEELDVLLCKIYEDNALGKLPDKRYAVLESQYTAEQEALDSEIISLQNLISGEESSPLSAAKFIALVKRYQDFEELTNVMLNEFIYKILVHEREIKNRPDSPQTIGIYFNFIGKFEMPREEHVPTPEEIELAERQERIRQQRHDAYMRRKSTGWQATYYWKNKRKWKAAMDAKKEALRAEDRANGVYYLPHQKEDGQSEQEKEAII